MQKIEQIVHACLGQIYGGYVRDLLAGVTPNDVDVYVKPKRLVGFIQRLSMVTSIRIHCAQPRLLDDSGDYPYYGFRFWTPDLDVSHIDVSFDNEHKPDANVNRLMISGGAVTVMPRYGHSIIQVLRDIAAKQYRAENGMSAERHVKLQSRGWTEVKP